MAFECRLLCVVRLSIFGRFVFLESAISIRFVWDFSEIWICGLYYGELYQLRQENKILSDTNENLESELNTLLCQLAIPSVRNMIFAVADALISGQPIPVSSEGGGGNSDSDLRWDGRRQDEEEDEYKRRCLMHAVQVVRNSQRKTIRR